MTTALCRVGQQVPVLQARFQCFETCGDFFFKAHLIQSQLNFLERKNLPQKTSIRES